MNLNELYNENKNPFQDVVDKVAAKEKQADAEHTKGLKDIADKFQNAEKKSSEEFSKKLRADEATEEDVAEAQLDELTGMNQGPVKRDVPQRKKPTFAELAKLSADKRSALQRQKDGGKKNWFAEDDVTEATGDKPFDSMMKNISTGTAKQKTADRKEQRTQTQQQARDAFGNMFGGGNPADKLKIKEQGVSEGTQSTTWVVHYDYGPHQSNEVKVKASSEDDARAKAVRWAKNHGHSSIMINRASPAEQGVAEGQFDLINDDDFYEYNVNTNEIVKRISGKHPIARQFSPMQKEWAGRDADHKIVKGMYAKYLKPKVNEKAPPGDKAERMVKHIKKNYSKDGKLTPTEKSIAYATAWKARNAGKV